MNGHTNKQAHQLLQTQTTSASALLTSQWIDSMSSWFMIRMAPRLHRTSAHALNQWFGVICEEPLIFVNERRQLITDLCEDLCIWNRTKSLSFRCHTFDHVTHIFGFFWWLLFQYSTKSHDGFHLALWHKSLHIPANKLTSLTSTLEYLRLKKN